MKLIQTTIALITSIALRADTAPPDVTVAAEAGAPAEIGQAVSQAVEQAGLIAQTAVQSVDHVIHQIGGKFAAAEDDEGNDGAQLFLNNGPITWEHVLGAPARTGGQPLIVRSSDAAAKNLPNLQEDLAIMSRILSKAAGREGHEAAMGIVLSALPGSRHPQSIYLEGYGALFLLNVKFPLVPTAV